MDFYKCDAIIQLKAVQDKYSSTLWNDSRQKKRHAVGTMSAVIGVVLVVIVVSLLLALLFSQTIVGPWNRLLNLQNETIMKVRRK